MVCVVLPLTARAHDTANPNLVYSEVVTGMPRGAIQSRPPVVVKAGQAFVEPPNVNMTGYNRSTTDPLRLVIFYVSEPDTPFLDPLN